MSAPPVAPQQLPPPQVEGNVAAVVTSRQVVPSSQQQQQAASALTSAQLPQEQATVPVLERWLTELPTAGMYEAIPENEIVEAPATHAIPSGGGGEAVPKGMGEQQTTQQYIEGQQQVAMAPPLLNNTSELVANVTAHPSQSRGRTVIATQQVVATTALTPDQQVALAQQQQLNTANELQLQMRKAVDSTLVAPANVSSQSLRRCQKASTAAIHMVSGGGLRADSHDALRPFTAQAIVGANLRRKERKAVDGEGEEERCVSPSGQSTGKVSASKKRRQRRVVRKASSSGVGATCSGVCYQSILQFTAPIEKAVDDTIVKGLVVGPDAMKNRFHALESVCELAQQAIRRMGLGEAIKFYIYGSVHLRTVLPNGDNDVTLALNSALANNGVGTDQILKRIEMFIAEKKADDTGVRVDRFVDASDVPVLKLESRNLHVDLSINQMGGTATSLFLHEVDAKIGNNHLFKKTLLLLKAWCYYEAHILGSDNGYLGTYALSVMLIAVINGLPEQAVRKGIPSPRTAAEGQKDAETTGPSNVYDDTIALTPLKLFLMFLDYYSTFDFDAFAISIHGPVAIDDIQAANVANATASLGFAATRKIANTLAASSMNLNRANGISVMGRRVGTCFTNNVTSPVLPKDPAAGVSTAGGDSPSHTPSLTPRGGHTAMAMPADAADDLTPCVAEAGNGLAYPSPCVTRDHLQSMVDKAAKSDPSIAIAHKPYYIHASGSSAAGVASVASGRASGGGGAYFAAATIGAPGVVSESALDGVNFSPTADDQAFPLANLTLGVNYFRVRIMNIRDPLRPYSNLTRGISRNHLVRIQASFKRGAKELRAFVAQAAAASAPVNAVMGIPLGHITPNELVNSMFKSTAAFLMEYHRNTPPIPPATAASAAEGADKKKHCQGCSDGTSPFCCPEEDNDTAFKSFDAVALDDVRFQAMPNQQQQRVGTPPPHLQQHGNANGMGHHPLALQQPPHHGNGDGVGGDNAPAAGGHRHHQQQGHTNNNNANGRAEGQRGGGMYAPQQQGPYNQQGGNAFPQQQQQGGQPYNNGSRGGQMGGRGGHQQQQQQGYGGGNNAQQFSGVPPPNAMMNTNNNYPPQQPANFGGGGGRGNNANSRYPIPNNNNGGGGGYQPSYGNGGQQYYPNEGEEGHMAQSGSNHPMNNNNSYNSNNTNRGPSNGPQGFNVPPQGFHSNTFSRHHNSNNNGGGGYNNNNAPYNMGREGGGGGGYAEPQLNGGSYEEDANGGYGNNTPDAYVNTYTGNAPPPPQQGGGGYGPNGAYNNNNGGNDYYGQQQGNANNNQGFSTNRGGGLGRGKGGRGSGAPFNNGGGGTPVQHYDPNQQQGDYYGQQQNPSPNTFNTSASAPPQQHSPASGVPPPPPQAAVQAAASRGRGRGRGGRGGNGGAAPNADFPSLPSA